MKQRHGNQVIQLAVADHLRKRRLELGLTFRAVAEKADMDLSHYLNLEKGKNDMRLSTLLRVLSALDLEFHLKKRKGQ